MSVSVDSRRIDDPLTQALAAELRSVNAGSDTELSEVCSHLLASRGKLLRGRLLLAAARQGPGFESPLVVKAACAVELLHLASLTHDDVIDSGTFRRGLPTAGAKFGQRAAAFAGAWMFARAVETIAECGEEALEPFTATAREMCEGGMREFSDLYDVTRTTSGYEQAAVGKTASAFRLAAQLGATLAGAGRATIADAAEFGLEFGMAYQVWDDLIDLLADPAKSGKTPGSDFRHGVYTLPVIFACEESDTIRRRLGAAVELTQEQDGVVAAVKATNGVGRAAAAADAHARRATTIMRSLPQPEPLGRLLAEVRDSHLGMLT